MKKTTNDSGKPNVHYMKWLHKLTVALYDKGLMMPTGHSELIECFYFQSFTIEKAVEQYIAHTTQRTDLAPTIRL